MMERRDFLAASLGVVFGVSPRLCESLKEGPPCKSVFRWDGRTYEKIEFEEIKKGDTILLVDMGVERVVADSDFIPTPDDKLNPWGMFKIKELTILQAHDWKKS